MIALKISVTKGVGAIERFRAQCPVVIDSAVKDTAAVGKRLIMSSTARGQTKLTRAAWDTLRLKQAVYKIWNKFPHARFLETGTGLFGPLKKRIFPKTAAFLQFPVYGNRMRRTGMTMLRKGKRLLEGGFVRATMKQSEKRVERARKLISTGQRKMDESHGGNTLAGWVRVKSIAGMPAQPMIAPNMTAIQNDLTLRMRDKIQRLWNACFK